MDVSNKYNDYQSLGQEFLTCLYFKANTQKTNYELGKKVVFTKFDDEKKPIEKTTISGDYSDTQTGRLLLSENAIITEMQVLFYEDEDVQVSDSDKYIVTLKASDLSFNGLKTPKIETLKAEEYESSILLKLESIEIVFEILDELYKEFLEMRFSDKYDEYKLQLKEFANIKENE